MPRLDPATRNIVIGRLQDGQQYMGHSFFRATVHMWQRANSNEQAFKIWPFNFTWLIAKFAF
jgi:hypothetical protein